MLQKVMSYGGTMRKCVIAGVTALSVGTVIVATAEPAQAFRGGFRGGYGGFRGGYGGFGYRRFGYGFGFPAFGIGYGLGYGYPYYRYRPVYRRVFVRPFYGRVGYGYGYRGFGYGGYGRRF